MPPTNLPSLPHELILLVVDQMEPKQRLLARQLCKSIEHHVRLQDSYDGSVSQFLSNEASKRLRELLGYCQHTRIPLGRVVFDPSEKTLLHKKTHLNAVLQTMDTLHTATQNNISCFLHFSRVIRPDDWNEETYEQEMNKSPQSNQRVIAERVFASLPQISTFDLSQTDLPNELFRFFSFRCFSALKTLLFGSDKNSCYIFAHHASELAASNIKGLFSLEGKFCLDPPGIDAMAQFIRQQPDLKKIVARFAPAWNVQTNSPFEVSWQPIHDSIAQGCEQILEFA